MKARFYLTCVLLSLMGCTNSPKRAEPITVITETVALEVFQPPLPAPAQLEDVKFHVITQENLKEKTSEISKTQGGSFVVFAVTPRDYENLAHNLQELRRVVRQYVELVNYYRDATKPKAGNTAKEWKAENEAQQKKQEEAIKSNRPR